MSEVMAPWVRAEAPAPLWDSPTALQPLAQEALSVAP